MSTRNLVCLCLTVLGALLVMSGMMLLIGISIHQFAYHPEYTQAMTMREYWPLTGYGWGAALLGVILCGLTEKINV